MRNVELDNAYISKIVQDNTYSESSRTSQEESVLIDEYSKQTNSYCKKDKINF